jgi:hypothetical protein
LEHCIREGWSGFSCEHCDAFEPEDAEDVLAELEGVLALLRMILHPKGTKFRHRRTTIDDFL